MLDKYFNSFQMRFSSISYTTGLINLEIGIAMGCRIFPIPFYMAMEVILKAAEGRAGPAGLGVGCYMPPLKTFMDETAVIYSNESKTRRMSKRLDGLMSWFRMNFKPKKSCSLSARKGKIDVGMTFIVANKQIPTFSKEPVKSLGRWYDSSMKDIKRGQETAELATQVLLATNRCGL